MSIADVTQQIIDIQSRLALLAQTVTSADGGAAFASALSGASETAPATATTATGSASGATATGSGVSGDDVVKAAMQYQGVPYVLGGESRSGMDCSGLVQKSFADLGVEVPRRVSQQQSLGQEVSSLKDAKPGDLVVLNGGNHIAIWMGNGQAIHAPYPGRTVSVQKAWFDDSDIVTIRRVVPATGDATSGTVSAVGASTAGTATSGASAGALAQATALLGMYGTSTGTSGADSLSSMLSGYGGTTGTGTTTQQLLAARAALAGS